MARKSAYDAFVATLPPSTRAANKPAPPAPVMPRNTVIEPAPSKTGRRGKRKKAPAATQPRHEKTGRFLPKQGA
jgi:hypothetical protein